MMYVPGGKDQTDSKMGEQKSKQEQRVDGNWESENGNWISHDEACLSEEYLASLSKC